MSSPFAYYWFYVRKLRRCRVKVQSSIKITESNRHTPNFTGVFVCVLAIIRHKYHCSKQISADDIDNFMNVYF